MPKPTPNAANCVLPQPLRASPTLDELYGGLYDAAAGLLTARADGGSGAVLNAARRLHAAVKLIDVESGREGGDDA